MSIWISSSIESHVISSKRCDPHVWTSPLQVNGLASRRVPDRCLRAPYRRLQAPRHPGVSQLPQPGGCWSEARAGWPRERCWGAGCHPLGPRGTAGVKGNHSICLSPPLEQRKTAGRVRELLGPADKHGYHAGCDRIPQHQTYGLPAPRCPGLEPRGSWITQVWYIRPQSQEWTGLRIVLDSRCGRMGLVVSTWSGSLEAGPHAGIPGPQPHRPSAGFRGLGRMVMLHPVLRCRRARLQRGCTAKLGCEAGAALTQDEGDSRQLRDSSSVVWQLQTAGE